MPLLLSRRGVSIPTARLDGLDGVYDDKDKEEARFEDLPEGFHHDVDSITVAVGGHHTCALQYRPGVDFGGPVLCWGRNDWGQSMPSDDVFVQASINRWCCRIVRGVSLDIELYLVCTSVGK